MYLGGNIEVENIFYCRIAKRASRAGELWAPITVILCTLRTCNKPTKHLFVLVLFEHH